MDAKQYLSQLKNLDMKIDCLERQKKLLWSKCQGSSSRLSGMPKNTNIGSGGFEGLADKAMDLQQKIDEKIDEMLDLKKTVIDSLDCMENNLYYTILFERYVNLTIWEKIAEMLCYDYKHLQRLHLKAIKEYQEKNQALLNALECDTKDAV